MEPPGNRAMLTNRKILVGITGGIAAYKVCTVISQLFQQGAEVKVIATQRAQDFITPLTLSTLSRGNSFTDQDFWQSHHPKPLHIALGEWADIFVIAPLTAHSLGKLSHGLADNLLTNTVLASRCPVVLVPAMNTEMWEQPQVQRNCQQLQRDPRFSLLPPTSGLLACDRQGPGKMPAPDTIIRLLKSRLHSQGQRDLARKKILVSGGSTREFLDSVRFLGNPSTGKMGLAIAQAAADRGAQVSFVHGPMAPELFSTMTAVQRYPVVSAAEMEAQILAIAPEQHWIIMGAAVADLRPTHQAHHKLPKAELPHHLPLETVGDIAATLGQRKQPHQTLIGFAAQTGDIITPALEKLQRKNLDGIFANSIDRPDGGFASNHNQGIFIDHQGQQTVIGHCSKFELAHRLLDLIHPLNPQAPSPGPEFGKNFK